MTKSISVGQSAHHQRLAVTIGKNTFFGVVARVAQVGTRLVTIPIVIAHLGLGGYGIWSIIMTTAAYMRFGSVGVKSAFQKYVAEATGNGDYRTANQLLSTGCAIMLAISVAGLIPISFCSGVLARAAGVPAEFLPSAAGAISMLALIMVLSNVGAVFEAIVMGGHRIDLARNLATFFTVAEAVAIVILLHAGYGLFAMAAVMAASEVGFVVCCYFASKKIVPQVRVRWEFVTKTAVRELVRFGGSYQLVNILEVLYVAIIPITVLRVFGAETAGVFALAVRLVQSSLMLPDAFLQPILSGGTMVYASGSVEAMRVLIAKSFKATLGLSLFPLAFISVFGTTMVLAWTGQADPSFQVALWLLSGAGLCSAFSLLALVLYRVSGRALLDNIRQGLRIAVLLVVAVFARRLGFFGVLVGLALAEMLGMLFMVFALTKTFKSFHAKSLLPDALKLMLATAGVMAAGTAAAHLPLPALSSPRILAVLQLAKVLFGCALAAWPALWLTKAVTGAEGKALLGVFLPRRVPATEPEAEPEAEPEPCPETVGQPT
jgi:O-antigen/teichoic acid export membrane protein